MQSRSKLVKAVALTGAILSLVVLTASLTLVLPGARRTMRRHLGAVAILVFVLVCAAPTPATATGANTITAPDTAGDVGRWSSIVIDATGNPVISYFNATNGDLKVLHCGNPQCNAGNAFASFSRTVSIQPITSIALDGFGYPVVAYSDNADRDLKVLHCGDATCSSGNVTATPDGAGAVVGEFSSLALDGSGNPVVSYHDQTNESLKIIHCGNPACTSGNNITSPSGNIGGLTSMVLDASGNPVVGYNRWVPPESTLKILHCGDSACSGGNTIATRPSPVKWCKSQTSSSL